VTDSIYDRLMQVLSHTVAMNPGELQVARDQRVLRSLLEELRKPTEMMVECGAAYGDPDEFYREEDKGEIAAAVWDAMMNTLQDVVDTGIELDGYTSAKPVGLKAPLSAYGDEE
jgi:hypothetical protein